MLRLATRYPTYIMNDSFINFLKTVLFFQNLTRITILMLPYYQTTLNYE